jgi:hypothetical protein
MKRFQAIFILISILISIVKTDYLIESTYKPNGPQIVALDCFKPFSNIYFDLDKRSWDTVKYSKCSTTEKDILSLCQRVYPDLNVVNIIHYKSVINFKVWECNNDKLNQNAISCLNYTEYTAQPYECLYGQFRSTELYIPKNCHFQHLFSNDGCKSYDHLYLLSKGKCKSLGLELNSSMLLQWCDAFKNGIGSFKGIEFTCCPDSTKNIENKINENVVASEESIFYKSLTKYKSNAIVSSTRKIINDEDSDVNDFNNIKYEMKKNDNTKLIEATSFIETTTSAIIDDQNMNNKHSNTNYLATTTIILLVIVLIVIVARYFKKRTVSRLRELNRNNNESTSICQDQHINNMQVNGYENPTYKLFENNKPVFA